MVKIVNEENNITHTLLECLDALAFLVFIELSNLESNDNLIAFTLSKKTPKSIPQLVDQVSPQPFNPMGNIQFVVFCLHAMALLGLTSNKLWNLDYDKIPLQKVQFLSTTFDGDALFELVLVFIITYKPS